MLDGSPMPLKLIHGPPNSGRAGLIRRGLIEVLDRDPVLVVPDRRRRLRASSASSAKRGRSSVPR